jgi:hypothetical protein
MESTIIGELHCIHSVIKFILFFVKLQVPLVLTAEYQYFQILTDQNMEDSDVVPAPKLIEVFFQNCKGRVDHWVEPYLRLTIDRLHRTEKPYLKCLLLQVVRFTPLVFICLEHGNSNQLTCLIVVMLYYFVPMSLAF